DTMPSTHDAALEKREGRFNGIGMNISFHIDPPAVVDGLMLFLWHSGPFHGEGVANEIIREDYVYVFADILTNKLSESFGLNIIGVEHSKLTVTLSDADHNFLIAAASSYSPSLASSFNFSTDVCFIHLYLAAKHGLIRLYHCV